MTLRVTRDGTHIATLPAQNYFLFPGATSTVLLTGFSLEPNDDWGYIINFLNFFSREEEKKYRRAESELKKDILAKIGKLENRDRLVEGEDALVSPLREMFKEKFVWKPGEYDIGISVLTSAKPADVHRAYRFTLFESDSAELAKGTDDYKFGDGINWDSGNHPGVVVQIWDN